MAFHFSLFCVSLFFSFLECLFLVSFEPFYLNSTCWWVSSRSFDNKSFMVEILGCLFDVPWVNVFRKTFHVRSFMDQTKDGSDVESTWSSCWLRGDSYEMTFTRWRLRDDVYEMTFTRWPSILVWFQNRAVYEVTFYRIKLPEARLPCPRESDDEISSSWILVGRISISVLMSLV